VWIYLGAALARQERFDEGRALLMQSVDRLDTPDTAVRYAGLIAKARTQLAWIDNETGQPSAAMAHARAALVALESALAPDARTAALAQLELGRALLASDDVAGSIGELRGALATLSGLTGDGSPETIRARRELAGALRHAGDTGEADIQIAAAHEGAASLPEGHSLRRD